MNLTPLMKNKMDKTKYMIETLEKNPNVSLKELSYQTGLTYSAVKNRLRRKGVNVTAMRHLFKTKLEENGMQNQWEYGWLKTDKASIFIKNEQYLPYEKIKDELIGDMKKYAPKYPKIKRTKDKNANLLIIDPADVHIGKLSIQEETGEEYNIKVAKQRCLDGVQGILNKANGFNIDKIMFIIGNDILHIDNPFRKTTAGTNQDTDGQWWKMFKEAKDLYVQIIERLITIADVEVIYCPSNHDYASGFMLADSLMSWFHNNKNITFNVDIVHRKYVTYGENLLAFSHGDGAKEGDVKSLMADEEPKLWGSTRFRYIYLHHIHHKKKISYMSAKDYIGVTLEYLRSPSGVDGWHNRNGYVAPKAIEGFIHSKNHGQIARLTHYF